MLIFIFVNSLISNLSVHVYLYKNWLYTYLYKKFILVKRIVEKCVFHLKIVTKNKVEFSCKDNYIFAFVYNVFVDIII